MPVFFWRGVVGKSEFLETCRKEIDALLNGTYVPRHLEKLRGHHIYSYRLSDKARLLFADKIIGGENTMIVLDYLPEHEYDKSPFLRLGPHYLEQFKENAAALVTGAKFEVHEAHLKFKPHKEQRQYLAVDLYRGTFVNLGAEQRDALEVGLPVIVSGVAGSGKSIVGVASIADTVAKLRVSPPEGNFKILYITHAPLLVKDMERQLKAALGAEPLPERVSVEFLSYSQYVEKQMDPLTKMVGKQEYLEWYKEFGRHQKRTHKAKSIQEIFLPEPEALYQEFRICCGYDDKKTYLATIGDRHSLFNREERELIYDMYVTYKKHLEAERFIHLDFYKFPERMNHIYDVVVHDEAQDDSLMQFKNIISMSKDDAVLAFMDTQQQIGNDAISKRGLFLQLFRGKIPKHIELPAKTYRCAPEIANVVDFLIEQKYKATGGIADRRETPKFVASDELTRGKVIIMRPSPTEDSDTLESFILHHKEDAIFAVVVLKEFLEEALERFSKDRVFTPEQIKGLQYDTVLLYRPFGKKLKEAVLESNKGEAREVKHRAKPGSDQKQHAPAFNEMITGASRAQLELVIYDDVSSKEVRDFMDKLEARIREDEKGDSHEVPLKRVPAVSSKEDWIKEILRLYENGDIARAELIYNTHLQDQEIDFRDFLREFQVDHSSPTRAAALAPSMAPPQAQTSGFKKKKIHKENAPKELSPKELSPKELSPKELSPGEVQRQTLVTQLVKDFSEESLMYTFLQGVLGHNLSVKKILMDTLIPMKPSKEGLVEKIPLLEYISRSDEYKKIFLRCLFKDAKLFEDVIIVVNRLASYPKYLHWLDIPIAFARKQIILFHSQAIDKKNTSLVFVMGRVDESDLKALRQFHESGIDLSKIKCINASLLLKVAAVNDDDKLLALLIELYPHIDLIESEIIIAATHCGSAAFLLALKRFVPNFDFKLKYEKNTFNLAHYAAVCGQVAIVKILKTLDPTFEFDQKFIQCILQSNVDVSILEAIREIQPDVSYNFILYGTAEALITLIEKACPKDPGIVHRMKEKVAERLEAGDLPTKIKITFVDFAEIAKNKKVEVFLKKLTTPIVCIEKQIIALMQDFSEAELTKALNDWDFKKLLVEKFVTIDQPNGEHSTNLLQYIVRSKDHSKVLLRCLFNNAKLFEEMISLIEDLSSDEYKDFLAWMAVPMAFAKKQIKLFQNLNIALKNTTLVYWISNSIDYSDIEALKWFHEINIDLNTINCYASQSLYNVAAFTGNEKLLKLLITLYPKADLNGRWIIYSAAEKGNLEFLRQLKRLAPDLNLTDTEKKLGAKTRSIVKIFNAELGMLKAIKELYPDFNFNILWTNDIKELLNQMQEAWPDNPEVLDRMKAKIAERLRKGDTPKNISITFMDYAEILNKEEIVAFIKSSPPVISRSSAIGMFADKKQGPEENGLTNLRDSNSIKLESSL